jgi:hypothetical protein
MTSGFVLYERNSIRLVVVEDSPLNEHVEIWVGGQRIAVLDSLGVLQPGDDVLTAYVELRVLHGCDEIAEDEDSRSFLYEVTK